MKNLGHYKVNNLIFVDKLTAILEATKTKSEITWHFNDEIYDKIDWTIEPETTLDDFYKIRATQIRENYDYVILMCSGGADSTNIAWSFLRNNIHVDEIIASAPVSGLKNWNVNDRDHGAGNTMSETALVQLPLMEEIHSLYPDVKITINDYFETLLEYDTDDWLFRSGEWIHPTSASRYNLEKLTHIRKLAEQGKKIAIVYGVDKPILFFDNENNIGTLLSDLAANVPRPAFNDRYSNVENVLFYYAPELPLMQVKQAHVLAKWIHLPENWFAKSKMWDDRIPLVSIEQERIRHSFYERAIVPCIYPSTHRKIFQGHKPTRSFLGEHDDWFYKMHHNTRTFDMIESDFRNFINEVDITYLNPSRTGFKLHTKRYIIGHHTKFNNLII